jgi:hypothetical protein
MVKIIFEYNNLEGEYALESAWAEKVGINYQLDNILFYAPGYSSGDVVEVEDRNGELFVVGLIEESGHTTVRIIFYEDDIINSTMIKLEELGCMWEGSNMPTLMSVDIASDIDYAPVKRFLDEGEERDLWGYEESCLAHDVG